MSAPTTINLATSYRTGCGVRASNPSAADLTDTSKCRKNSDYLYPNATYKYGRSSGGSSSNVWAFTAHLISMMWFPPNIAHPRI